MTLLPLRKNRDFVLLQVGPHLVRADRDLGAMLLLSVIGSVSPSIRKAPNLDELDRLPTREASPAGAG